MGFMGFIWFGIGYLVVVVVLLCFFWVEIDVNFRGFVKGDCLGGKVIGLLLGLGIGFGFGRFGLGIVSIIKISFFILSIKWYCFRGKM